MELARSFGSRLALSNRLIGLAVAEEKRLYGLALDIYEHNYPDYSHRLLPPLMGLARLHYEEGMKKLRMRDTPEAIRIFSFSQEYYHRACLIASGYLGENTGQGDGLSMQAEAYISFCLRRLSIIHKHIGQWFVLENLCQELIRRLEHEYGPENKFLAEPLHVLEKAQLMPVNSTQG